MTFIVGATEIRDAILKLDGADNIYVECLKYTNSRGFTMLADVPYRLSQTLNCVW